MRRSKIVFALIFFVSIILVSSYALSYKQDKAPYSENSTNKNPEENLIASDDVKGNEQTDQARNNEESKAIPEPAGKKPGSAFYTQPPEITKKKKDSNTAYIAFTFDDGYLSDYELAYPILKKYNIRGTSYIIPEYQDENRPYAMTWPNIKEMAQYGWVFGCHTYAHTDLKKMSPNEIKKSMQMVNDSFIRQGLAPPVIHAFPFGSYDRQAIDAMKPYRVQMRKAFYESNLVDINRVDPYEIDSVSADMRTEKRLKLHKEMVDQVCREKSILVFRCHCLYRRSVNDMGEWPVQTDSELFRQLVEYCVSKGCEFITMTELLEMYR